VNDVEIQRLANAMNALRPDWKVSSLRTFLTNHFADRAYRDTAVAAAWIATDDKTNTPELLRQPGPWWNVGPAKPPGLVPRVGPEPGEERCQFAGHEHESARRCRLCAAERAAGDAPEPAAAPVPPPAAIVELARRHRAKTAAAVSDPETRSFVQDQELRQPDPFGGATCVRAGCGGWFIQDAPGAAAHKAVFGHLPEAAE
jgi:hypothetical protein